MMTISTPFKINEKGFYTVALIDSDRSVNQQIAEYLRNSGWKVLQAFSSDEIPEVVAQQPDFIVIDPIYESCDEFKLCDYLSNPESAGVVVFSTDADLQRRSYLFQCGILEYFSKNEPLEYVCEEFTRLFETIRSNPLNQITMISSSELSQKKFRNLVIHRKYKLSFLSRVEEAHQKWDHHNHELPDLLVLDLKSDNDIEQVFELIRYVRIHRLSEMPIIILFENNQPNLFARLYRMGINNILSEPYSSEKLLSKVTRHLDYRIDKKLLNYEQNLSSQLKAMIDSSSIVSKADSRGIITYVNEQFCTITGYSREELIGKPHSIIRHPQSDPMLFRQMWKTIQNKQIFNGMIMNRRKDGTTYYVNSTIAPVLDDSNAIIEYISIRHDVTPLIEKQHEIDEQRRQIQNVLDAQTSLVCMVDKMKGVVQSNRGFMEFLGITSLEPEHSGFQNLYELFLDIQDTLQVKNGERYVWLEHLYEMRNTFVKVAMLDHDYNHHIFSIHVEKIPDHRFSGGICYLVSFENVSELNRALLAAKEASEAESRFLATMSHEIRTPLNGILGFAELLQETPLNEEQKKYLQAISYSGDTLRQIINDILNVMKLDREQLELHNEKTNLIQELEAIVYPFYAQAAKKRVDMLVLIDPNLPVTVETDILHLKQILINLISNAIKFTPPEKRIHVRIKKLHAADGKVRIGFTVADEGIGVKAEHKERIFKAFTQADNSIAREYGGTGLGLNIVIRVTAAMGGKIAFKSHIGKGSVFHTVLEFIDVSPSHPYIYHCKDIRLCCPVSKIPPRFKLVEHYLKRFGCAPQTLRNLRQLHTIDDHDDLSIILFMDCMKMSEITAVIDHYKKANLYLIASFMPVITSLPLNKTNLTWVTNELTWSNLAKQFHLYEPKLYPAAKYEKFADFGKLRILVAEDNEVNRFYIQEILKKFGFEIDVAHDGNEAIAKFMHQKYDLILMDINMPNLDGISATRQIIRYEHETARVHTPIIGISADAVEKNIKHYIRQGLDGYLVKPLRKSDFIKLFHEFFPAQITLPITVNTPSEVIDTVKTADTSLLMSISQKLELPEEIVAELFRKFINNTQTLLQQMHEQYNDSSQLKMAIHSLKGISKNLYIEPLGTHCQEFETKMGTLTEEKKIKWIKEITQETESYIYQMQTELEC